MAAINIASNGCLYIELSPKEATKIDFGIQTLDSLISGINLIVCGSCNAELSERPHMYYLACINEVLCEECFNDYVKCMKHYIDKASITYELEYAKHYCDKLNINVDIKHNNGKFIITKKEHTEGK